ncbi:hypothetical protein ACC870_38040, partial [Rhizobium ruizarguesonis]
MHADDAGGDHAEPEILHDDEGERLDRLAAEKGRIDEGMLRRIRFELIDRVLRFPPINFKRVKSAEIATMIKDEVEPMGGFTG